MKPSVSTINSLPAQPKWGNVRARSIRYGSYVIETELPCINGLSAWFTIATVHCVDDAEILMSDGAIGTAKQNADAIVAALSAAVRASTEEGKTATPSVKDEEAGK